MWWRGSLERMSARVSISYIPDPLTTSDLAPAGQIWLCPYCVKWEQRRQSLGPCAPIAVLVYEASLMIEDGVLISAEAVNDPNAEIVW